MKSEVIAFIKLALLMISVTITFAGLTTDVLADYQLEELHLESVEDFNNRNNFSEKRVAINYVYDGNETVGVKYIIKTNIGEDISVSYKVIDSKYNDLEKPTKEVIQNEAGELKASVYDIAERESDADFILSLISIVVLLAIMSGMVAAL